MAITRLAISNPAANTDTLIHTAVRGSVASVIVTNKGAISSNIRVWVIPSGQDATPANWIYIAYNVSVEAGNTMETFRFPLVSSDKLYIRSSTADCSFSLNSLYETNGTSNISVQSTAPASPQIGDVWVDTDDNKVYFWNGTSWVDAVTELPSQTGNSGKYLTTNGTSTSWGTIDLSGYATNTSLTNHESDTTNIHGIADTSQLATQTYVNNQVASLVNSAPATLDTLNELAIALGNDANFATTVTNSISGKVSKSGGDSITVSSGTTVPLTIQNNGTGNSFVVNDGASDTTPFIIDADGNVGIGNAPGDFSSRLLVLTPNGTASRFTLAQAGITNYSWQIPASTDAIALVYGASTERMRIDASGNITVTGAITNNTADTTIKFQGANATAGSYTFLLAGSNDTGLKAVHFINGSTRTADGGANAYTIRNDGGALNLGQAAFQTNVLGSRIVFSGTVEAPVSTNAQTGTAYTLVLTDAGKVIEMNNANANTLTVPLNSSVPFPIGTKIDIIQTGAGATSISPTAGVTLNSDTNKRTINSQWAAATLIKRATDTWVLVGALKA